METAKSLLNAGKGEGKLMEVYKELVALEKRVKRLEDEKWVV